MRKQTVMLSALVLLGALPLFQQTKEPAKSPAQKPTEQSQQQTAPSQQQTAPKPIVIPPAAAKQVNPVKPTAKSLAAGKHVYDIDCAFCHAKNGDGKTPVAASMKLKLPDFQNPQALKSVTDGGLYYVISKGHSPMPNEDVRAKPNQIWDLVNYIRSLSEKATAAKSK